MKSGKEYKMKIAWIVKKVWIFAGVGMALLLCMGSGGVSAGAASGKESSWEGVYTYQEKFLLSVNSVNADLDNLDFKIKRTKKKEAYLSYKIDCKNSKNPLSWQMSDGVLYLKESGLERLSWKETRQKYGQKWWGQGHWPEVILYVPENMVVKNSKVRMDEGDFSVGKEVVCQNMDVRVKVGDVLLSGFRMTGQGSIGTVDGDVKGGAFCVEGNLHITSKYGDVQTVSPQVPGNLDITAEDGAITALGMRIQGEVQVKSREGDIIVQPGQKDRSSLGVTADAGEGSLIIREDMKGGMKKRRGLRWQYKKAGSGKGHLKISAKYGDVLLK